ncbi:MULTISPECIES: spore coat protein B, partial [unclassified Bacillus cereus group]
MNMKKAIIVIASTAIAFYTIKNRKKKHNKNDL